MNKILVLLSCILLISACKAPAPAGTTSSDSPNAKRYSLKGKVTAVNRAAKKATIEHDSIPGYMDGMTMEFPIHEDWVWDDLVPGAEIRAELVVDNTAKDPFWLEKIGILAAPDPNNPAPPINENFAQIGRPVPDFSLTNQSGKRISIKDFQGKTLAITFIYARCPLPEYCIRMSTNFSDLARQIGNDPEYKDKLRLLSISFNPANDTPEKLKAYGIGYMGNDVKYKFDIWQLAGGTTDEVRKVADFFGLQYTVDPDDKTKINHTLRTAIIGADGKVIKIFPGSTWTMEELLSDMKAATKGTPR